MGDEVRRTQRGNNNAYCHNDEITWFDWDLVARHGDVHRFVKGLIALRVSRNLPIERSDMTLQEMLRHQAVTWHGVKLNAPDWGHESHTLAATIRLPATGPAPRHRQRLLGGARLRASAARRWPRRVAAHHRHVARFTRRRAARWADAPTVAGRDVCRAAAFSGDFFRGDGDRRIRGYRTCHHRATALTRRGCPIPASKRWLLMNFRGDADQVLPPTGSSVTASL